MEDALWHKFNQHSDLKAELLSTGNAELIEVSRCDWPNQNDGKHYCTGFGQGCILGLGC